MLMAREQPKHTLFLYAESTLFSILVMAPYKWYKKWMRVKTSVGILFLTFHWSFTSSVHLIIECPRL